MHWPSLSSLLVLLLQVTNGFAFRSIATTRSADVKHNEVPQPSRRRFTNKPPFSSSTLLWATTLVVAEDRSVSYGVSLVNGGNGNVVESSESSTGSGDAPVLLLFLHPSVKWWPFFSQNSEDIPTLSAFKTVHVVLQGKEDAENLMQNLPSLTSVTCLGIHVVLGGASSSSSGGGGKEEANRKVAPETAQRVGALLQEILDATETNQDLTTVVMSLDLPVHLAMLQANCLPKSRAVERHLFHVLQHANKKSCKSILAEYLYDWDNPFGGTDPLARPSREVCSNSGVGAVSSSTSISSALTTLLGLGVEPLDAVRDAQIVASCVPSSSGHDDFVWEEAVQQFLASYSKSKVEAWTEDGILRKEYIEFGYK